MPEYGCNRYQPNVRNVVICSCLEQQHIRQHSLPARTKYENRCILVFTLQLLLGITFVLYTNTINQYNARKRVQPVPSKWRNVVICSCWSNLHIGQHSLPEITKHENRCLLVFTLPLDGITGVSWINTINQYKARRWGQPVPAKCT